MKAVRFSEYGDFDVLRVEEVARRPSRGRAQVLLRVRAAGVNPIDWKVAARAGSRAASRSPRRAGSASMSPGVVEKVGPGVEGIEPGEEVLGNAATAPTRSSR